MTLKSPVELKMLVPQIDLGGQTFKEKATEIEVLQSGEWEHPQYGIIRITEDDIDKFVQSFDDGVRKVDIAIDQEHMPEKGAAGWYKSLRKVVEDGKAKLTASVEWTALGKQLLNDGVFKYFSPEFDFDYEDMETHEAFDNVLIGGALTNRPYFKSLAPVMLSENMYARFGDAGYKCECVKCGVTVTTDKHCRDIKCPKCGGQMRRAERPGAGFNDLELSKGGEKEAMTKDELKAQLAEDSEFVLPEDATDEDKAAFEEASTELAEEAENKEEGDEAPEGDEEGEEEEEKDETVKASENFISKAEHSKQMNELKSKMGVVEKKLRFKEVTTAVQGYVFSESNPDGVLLPKNTEAAINILMASTPKSAKLFTEFLTELPAVSAKLFTEQGGSEGDSGDNAAKVERKADKMIEEGKAQTYGEAVKTLQRNEPELFED